MEKTFAAMELLKCERTAHNAKRNEGWKKQTEVADMVETDRAGKHGMKIEKKSHSKKWPNKTVQFPSASVVGAGRGNCIININFSIQIAANSHSASV